RVQGHARLAVAHLAERKLQVARAAEVADAQLIELARGRGSLDRAQGLALERLSVHARDCIAFTRHSRPPPVRVLHCFDECLRRRHEQSSYRLYAAPQASP